MHAQSFLAGKDDRESYMKFAEAHVIQPKKCSEDNDKSKTSVAVSGNLDYFISNVCER